MSNQPITPTGYQEPRPDNLPLTAAIWDASHRYGRDSQAVAISVYAAIKRLEAEVIALRTR